MSLLDEPLGDDDATEPGWQPSPWWAWTAALLVAGVILLAWAGMQLSSGTLGTSLRARSCDGGVLAAVGLLALGAACVLAGMLFARLRHPGALLAWDASTLPWTLPVPVLLLAFTLPGVAGCRLARSLDDLPLVGDAFVGASGIVLCGSAAALLAAALVGTAGVSWLAPNGIGADEPPGIVEQAMLDADAFQAERAGERFHGVDPLE
ncbi:MAG: hypothetical protein KDC46_09330 [Thermoleophilia bacterium]|nr:hypothetical protein [Thermoleophilia bacterium]